ncbi:opie1 pol protein, partial [Chrysochromulina tobinii]
MPNPLKHGSILKAVADTRGSSLFDGGATHIVHEDDKGAIPGSWQPDVAGLRLGDDTFIPAFGSVLKDFIPPPDVGGPDIRRRVLIAPAVASRVWSGTQEVDMYGSTFVDSPTKGKYLQLEDGRILKLRLASNGLRMLDLRVRPTEAVINTLFAIHPAPSLDSAALCRITGVGKRHLPLAPIEFLRLWHCILGHLSSRRLLATLRHTLVLANVPVLAPDVVKAYEKEHCDVCNAFLQKRASAPALAPVASGVRAETDLPPSVGRALRPLYRILLDVFGPVPWASAQFGYRFVLGLICEATMMRWIFGLKTHTENDVEGCINLFLASMRLLRPDLSIDIIRSDGAPENRSHRWAAYLQSLGVLHEQSIAYDSHQMGAIENTWNLVPSAGAMLAVSNLGKTHWYTALRYAVLLSNIVQSNVTGGVEKMTSAFERFYGTKPCGDHLNVYGAPIRYHVKLHTMGRDDKFDEHALPGFYVGPSPENPEEKYVWTGTRHISIGGSFVIDESRFLQPIHLSSEYFDSWPMPTPDSTLPLVQPPPPPTKTAQVLKEPLLNGTVLEFRYANSDYTAWEWYSGKVVSWRRRADNGVEHEIEWLDKRWTQNDWVNLASSVRIWRLPASSPPLAPSPAPAPPAATPAAPPVARATRSSARTAALNRTRAVQPRVLIFDSGASNVTFVRTLKAKGWLIDVVTDSSTPRDVTVRSVQRELRDNIENGAYDHIVIFAPPIAVGTKIVSIVAALALVARKSEVPFTIIGVRTDAVWTTEPMTILKRIKDMLEISFPVCSFGAQTSLLITLWTTSEPVRSKFADLECTHGMHASSTSPAGLPDAASIALAQTVASTAVTDVAPAFTTKIDGMHPLSATRYDKAAAGLHRRSVQTDEPALNAFLSTAADIADMPLCVFCQDDVPSELVSTTATLLKVTSDEQNELDIGLLDVPDEDDGPTIDAVLYLAKGKKFSIDRKEVVYHTDGGVVHALEPRGIKEALTSLQRDQWMLAIEKEMDNLRAHDAFHYVPVKEALAQGKRIMRMTWVFKIKTHDTGALDKFKARFCVVGTSQVKGQDYFESFASGARGT